MNQNATFVHNNKVHGWQPFVWNLYPYYNDTWDRGLEGSKAQSQSLHPSAAAP